MEDKRKAILDTSLRLFVEQGFHATPTSQIAKDAGAATGTLFHYFKTKEELIDTLFLETQNMLVNKLSIGVDEQISIKGKLKQIFYNAINWSLAYPTHQLFYYQYIHSPFISKIKKEPGEHRLQFVYDIIEEGKQTDVLKDFPTGLLFETALGLMNGIIVHLMEAPEKATNTNYLEQVFSLLWDALKG